MGLVILGPVVGTGRTCVVHALDDERVLRRVQPGIDVTAETAALAYAIGQGYPAPQVFEVHGQDMIMQRVDGPTMLTALAGGGLGLEEAAEVLADLLRRLHALPPRPGAASGTRLLHLDLHPDNVMLSATGPVVIDWANARDGAPALDVAMSAVILAQVAVDDEHPAAPAAGALLAAFLRHGLDLLDELPTAARLRGGDPMMSERELALIPAAATLVGKLAG